MYNVLQRTELEKWFTIYGFEKDEEHLNRLMDVLKEMGLEDSLLSGPLYATAFTYHYQTIGSSPNLVSLAKSSSTVLALRLRGGEIDDTVITAGFPERVLESYRRFIDIGLKAKMEIPLLSL